MKNQAMVVAVTCALIAAAAGGVAGRGAAPDQSSQAPHTPATPAASAAAEALAAMAPLVGEWTIDAVWDSGQPLKARNTYAWGVGGKHLRTATFLPQPGGGEIQRYEGIMTWHQRRESLVAYSFAVDGKVSEFAVDLVGGKTFRFGFRPWDAGVEPTLRQTTELVDADTLQWTVEMRTGTEWKRLISAPWKRVKPVAK